MSTGILDLEHSELKDLSNRELAPKSMHKSDIPYSCKRGKAYRTYIYQTAGDFYGTRSCIPLAVWCRQNFCSRSKALRMLRNKCLLGLTYQGKLYIYDCKNETLLAPKQV